MSREIPTRVLLVEDHPDMRSVVADLLEGSGYRVTAAPDVPTARAALTHSAFDVVVCDLRLGGASGFEVLAEAQRQTDTPAIAFSAASGAAAVRRSLSAGFAAHVVKGTPFETLCETIERVRRAA